MASKGGLLSVILPPEGKRSLALIYFQSGFEFEPIGANFLLPAHVWSPGACHFFTGSTCGVECNLVVQGRLLVTALILLCLGGDRYPIFSYL